MDPGSLGPRTGALIALAVMAGLASTGGHLAAQQRTPVFTHADTLRGALGPGRDWWDVTFYDLHVRVSPADSSISGWNGITYRVTKPGREMQIDLQPPLVVDSMKLEGRALTWRRDGSAFFVALPAEQRAGESHTVTVHYHGKPVVARRPPWDGGAAHRESSRCGGRPGGTPRSRDSSAPSPAGGRSAPPPRRGPRPAARSRSRSRCSRRAARRR